MSADSFFFPVFRFCVNSVFERGDGSALSSSQVQESLRHNVWFRTEMSRECGHSAFLKTEVMNL